MIAPKESEAAVPRVALCPLGGSVQPELTLVLSRRGVLSNIATLSDARRQDVGAIAAVARSSLTRSMTSELAPLCREAALAGRPVILLAPATCFKTALERAQISAFLEAAGAIVLADPDVWLETLVLVAAFGLPRGPRVALVFPTGGWLDDAAEALARARHSSRLRALLVSGEQAGTGKLEPTDIVLCDPAEMPREARLPPDVIVAPLAGRGELVVEGSPPTLVGLRSALLAAEAAGNLRLRINEGIGDASERVLPDDIDTSAIAEKLGRAQVPRFGDHETKVILKAAGVSILRQAVATSASAATRLARRAGFPVEMKPWGSDVVDEQSGCPVESGLLTAADVRRAFAALCDDPKDSAIVRETPPQGRELSVLIEIDRYLGAMMTVRIRGQRDPHCAVSPLSDHDAEHISRRVAATRVDDPQPALDEVAELLQRASFLHREVASMDTLSLPRVVAGENEAVVVDAWATFRV